MEPQGAIYQISDAKSYNSRKFTCSVVRVENMHSKVTLCLFKHLQRLHLLLSTHVKEGFSLTKKTEKMSLSQVLDQQIINVLYNTVKTRLTSVV